MSSVRDNILVRTTHAEDFGGIIETTCEVYPASPPWREEQLASHVRVFPEGQFVAVERNSERIVGMAASLIVLWDDYDTQASWRDFTDHGMFTNHDPENGHTLYGAEVMVRPSMQGFGVGKKLYQARHELVTRLGLRRIRAGARLRGYHHYAARMGAEEYVIKVVRGELSDPTLSFQLKRGFHIIAVVPDYLHHDPESLGHAAVIEWINLAAARPEISAGRDPKFMPEH